MGEMRKLSARGDDRVEWDPRDQASVDAAEKKFRAAIKAGHSAFTVEEKVEGGLRKESRGARVDEWDPKLEVIVLVPRLVGG